MSNGLRDQRPQLSMQDTYVSHGSNCQMESQSKPCGMQNVALLRNIIYSFQQLYFVFTVTEADPELQAWYFSLTS